MSDLSFADMGPGTSFFNRLCLKTHLDRRGGGSGPELKMTLNDGSGGRVAKKWQATKEENCVVMLSRFLLVSGRTDKGELTLTSVQATDEPEDISPFLSPLPSEHKNHALRFCELMKSVREPNLAALLRVIFDAKSDTWKRFKTASAAQTRHHAYRGGLLEHTVEVTEGCESACRVYPHLKRDLLITGALLHDIGKLDEMDHGLGLGEFTECGTLIGHVNSGAFLVQGAADQVPNFPCVLKQVLTNMILSHHGQAEWGAAKAPAFAEAFILHNCDNMSAKARECRGLVEAALPGQIAVKRGPGEYLYVGDYGLQEPMPPLKFVTKAEPEVNTSFGLARLPIMSVAAGFAGQSSEEVQDTREVVLPVGGADYLLRVVGESMIGAGILPSDLLFIKAQEECKDGEIVIANVASHGEVVKRLRRDLPNGGGGGRVWLDSENPAPEYQPIPVDEDTRIHGKVVGLLREF